MKESSIQVAGNLGPDPLNLVRSMMSAIQVKVGFGLCEVPETQVLASGEWTMCLDSTDQRPNGRIRVQLGTSLAVKQLEQAAHHQVVTVGSEDLTVKVSNFQVMDLPRCTGNGMGASGALLGPPPGL